MSRNRRHEGIGTGREHQLVVRHFVIARGAHGLFGAVYRNDRIVQPQRDRFFFEESRRHHAEVDGRLAREETRELDAVIGRARFLAENRYVDCSARHVGGQLFQKALADHAVADDDDFFGLHGGAHAACRAITAAAAPPPPPGSRPIKHNLFISLTFSNLHRHV